MFRFALLLAAPFALFAAPAASWALEPLTIDAEVFQEEIATLSVEVVQEAPAIGVAVVEEAPTISVEVVQETPATEPGGDRFVVEVPSSAADLSGVASFGPFRVIDSTRAALVDSTGTATPRQFAQMLIAFPGLRTIEMIECPGTTDDTANMRLGRMIRRAGLDTHVPKGGSVRSGAVELFLAGKHRRAESGAEFAVHSWQDSDGLEASDVPENDPVNLAYLAYYREMGLSDHQARAFYAMTNAAPHDGALWLSKEEFAAYAPLD